MPSKSIKETLFSGIIFNLQCSPSWNCLATQYILKLSAKSPFLIHLQNKPGSNSTSVFLQCWCLIPDSLRELSIHWRCSDSLLNWLLSITDDKKKGKLVIWIQSSELTLLPVEKVLLQKNSEMATWLKKEIIYKNEAKVILKIRNLTQSGIKKKFNCRLTSLILQCWICVWDHLQINNRADPEKVSKTISNNKWTWENKDQK